MNIFKLFLVVLAMTTLLLSCKGPDCDVSCKGHNCACEKKQDAVEVPEEVTPSKMPWDVVPCEN